ncbi:MAG: hypothetical protein ACYC1M_12840 [Armatimonadota bacterium]
MSKVWASILCMASCAYFAAVAGSITIGSKFPVAVASHNQLAYGAAYDGTNYMVAIQGDIASKNGIGAQIVSTEGVKVGSPISTGRTGSGPLIAFDGNRYLMVWTDNAIASNENIYGCFITPEGSPGATFAISTAVGNQVATGLAFDGTNYLVVWEDYRKSNEGSDIYGKLISPAGALVGSEINICMFRYYQLGSTVAFDGTNYFVCWMDQRYGIDDVWDVYGCFVSKSGVVTNPIQINQTDCPAHYNPLGLAYGPGGYLVAWNKDTGPGGSSPAVWDVYGRVVAQNGSFVCPEFAITTDEGSQLMPRVAAQGSRFLVAWSDSASVDMKISGRLYTSTGSAAGAAFTILSGTGPRLVYPMIYGGGRYFLGVMENLLETDWKQADVYGMYMQPDVTSLEVNVDPGLGFIGSLNTLALSYSLVGSPSYTGTLALDNSGKAMIGGVEPGIFSLSIYGSHWLKRVVPGVSVDGVNVVNTLLTNGDSDGNGQINLFDFVVLDSKFASSYAMADLNGDGMVNLFDYVIIDQNFGAQAD